MRTFSVRETPFNARGTGVNFCLSKFNLKFTKNSFTRLTFVRDSEIDQITKNSETGQHYC